MSQYDRPGKPGAEVIGSHVQKTTQQLELLLKMPGVEAVEVDVDLLEGNYQALRESILKTIDGVHESGKTVVVYTRRKEKGVEAQEKRLQFGSIGHRRP